MNNKDLNKPGLTLIALSIGGFISPIISRLLANHEGIFPWLIDLAANWQGLYFVMLLIGVLSSAKKQPKFILLLALGFIPLFTAIYKAPQASGNQPGLT